MTIPKRLSEAMDSLTVNHEWGGVNEMPEEILAPDDWRLQEISTILITLLHKLISCEKSALNSLLF